MEKFSNQLVHESSPYLLQHAHNPVNWFSWGDEALTKAKSENKLMIISIGYSACHWCHVMEHESFEDLEVAKIMNQYFVSIKVDREERPDIDLVYMQAVQLMTGQGGWPLNCIALPDGKPVYGGTYFNKNKWVELLKNLAEGHKRNNAEFLDYALNLVEAMKSSDRSNGNTATTTIDKEVLKTAVKKWTSSFDLENGGNNRAPKFPMPHNYLFLLRYGFLFKDESVTKHVNNTLAKMACGGIYDQLAGGFARYSVDEEWKVPHFEKMLYDNAQLVSLYAEAYQCTKNEMYKQIVFETLNWIENDMTTSEGAFYSAIDADSEGEEGRFYTWNKEELKKELEQDYEFAKTIFCVDERGLWENDHYILLKNIDAEKIKNEFNLNDLQLTNKVESIKKKLIAARNKRVHPSKDDKIITSWNAMMAKGYLDAYKVFEEKKYLEAALRNINFILSNQKNKNQLYHCYKNGKSTINGFLEDYCFLADTLLSAYSITFDEKWLNEAVELIEYTMEHFYNPEKNNFYFTDNNFHQLITRPVEMDDNVVPASNSVMANILHKIGLITNQTRYIEIAEKMVSNVNSELQQFPSAYTNWGLLYLNLCIPFHQVVFSGINSKQNQTEFSKYYLPNLFTIGCEKESKIAMLKNKFEKGKSLIFVCENQSCQLPVETVAEAIHLTIHN